MKPSFAWGALMTLAGATSVALAKDATYDVILRGGTVIDGSGKARYVADVAFRGDRIAAIGSLDGDASSIIDARGLMVTPGFIDSHSHSDMLRMKEPHGPSFSLQGITTEVWGESDSMGPIGGKEAPLMELSGGPMRTTWKTLGEFMDALEKNGSAANFGSYVASGQIRAHVVGYDDRPVTPDELQQEKELVREAMREGALGLSSGLSYVPNIYMSTQELIELAKEAAAGGGLYATHARTINGQDAGAIREAIAIADAARIRVHFFHLNSIASWSADTFLPIIDEARTRGVQITADAYPYTWGISGLSDYLPSSALAGGLEAMLARLRDPAQRAQIARGFTTEPPYYATIGWQNVRLGVHDPKVNGKLVTEVAAMRGIAPDDAYLDVVLEQKGQGLIIDLNNREDTLRKVIQQPYVAMGTDGYAIDLSVNPPLVPLLHPRLLGAAPRWLGRFVREEHLMSWEEAIRRMTSLPASTLRLKDRGVLAVGTFADIAVFHPKAIVDHATFEDPNHYSEGVRYLFVNGQAVVRNGEVTQSLPGRALRGPGYAVRQ